MRLCAVVKRSSGQTIKWSNDQVKISRSAFGDLQNPFSYLRFYKRKREDRKDTQIKLVILKGTLKEFSVKCHTNPAALNLTTACIKVV